MRRRDFLAAGGAAAFAAPQKASRPNIVLILADDLGYGDLGCYGQRRIETPNLDRMAAEGVRFTQAYAGSTVCAPSRCALETGLHTGHARVRGNRYPDMPLAPGDATLGKLLQQAGYRTGLFGKWSLGGLGTTGFPLRQGYDEFFGFFSQTHAHNYYPEHLLENEQAYLLRGNFGAKRTEYAHDLFTERALRFLEKSDSRPFFLYVAYTIPHANNEMGRDTGDGMQVPDYGAYGGQDWPNPEKGFAAMISRMDRDVGRILAKLGERGLAENTLVVFSSDNGPHQEGGHRADFFESSGPLRGIKRDLYEGGIRVPTLAWWPGTIRAAQVSDHVWAFWDILATCAELAGVAAPRATDGVSIVPALTGGKQPRHEYLYWEFHERRFHQAARMGPWKAVRLGRRRPIELYNLEEDLGEKRDVAARHPGVVKQMEEILEWARTDTPDWPVREASAE